MPPAASALAVGRTVAYLRKKCVRVARDDDDAQMSERARCDRRTEGRRDGGCDGQAVASVAVRHLQEREDRAVTALAPFIP